MFAFILGFNIIMDVFNADQFFYAVIGSIGIQLTFFLVFILSFIIITIKRRPSNFAKQKKTQKTPISFLLFLEYWNAEETSKKLNSFASKISADGEFIVLITSEYLMEAKMVFSKLEKKYGDRFRVCTLHEKTRGLDLSKLALLSGVRMSRYDYVCFLTASRVLGKNTWMLVPEEYYKNASSKQNLMVGYNRILGANKYVSNFLSLSNLYIQILSNAMLHLGIKFLPIPFNVAFSKSQYLENGHSFKRGKEGIHLGTPFLHLKHIKFSAKIFWDKTLTMTDEYKIDFNYIIHSFIRFMRTVESNWSVFALLFGYCLSFSLMLIGLLISVTRPEIFDDYQTYITMLWYAVGVRFFCYWVSFIYLGYRVGEKTSICLLVLLYDVFYGLLSIPIGFLLWILKPFRKS